jgi:hypothetical protein
VDSKSPVVVVAGTRWTIEALMVPVVEFTRYRAQGAQEELIAACAAMAKENAHG